MNWWLLLGGCLSALGVVATATLIAWWMGYFSKNRSAEQKALATVETRRAYMREYMRKRRKK